MERGQAVLLAPGLLRVVRNPSEMQSSVPVRGSSSPVEGGTPRMTCRGKDGNSHPARGEMPRTSCSGRKNSRPKERGVLAAKPARAAAPRPLLGGAGGSGGGSNLRSERCDETISVGTDVPTSFLHLSPFPSRAQVADELSWHPLGREGSPRGAEAGGAAGRPAGTSAMGLWGSGSSCDVFGTHPSAARLLTPSASA